MTWLRFEIAVVLSVIGRWKDIYMNVITNLELRLIIQSGYFALYVQDIRSDFELWNRTFIY